MYCIAHVTAVGSFEYKTWATLFDAGGGPGNKAGAHFGHASLTSGLTAIGKLAKRTEDCSENSTLMLPVCDHYTYGMTVVIKDGKTSVADADASVDYGVPNGAV